jgi:hypothetical protein
MACLLDAHRDRVQNIRYETPFETTPAISTVTYLDTFGNHVRRFIAPAGDLTIRRDAIIEDSGQPDLVKLDAEEIAIERLPNVDKLSGIAWQLFESRATRTAYDAYQERVGVCRDFAHLAVAFCRCMNIPARYANGFLGDIGVPPDPAPMDYNAWFEVFFVGRWFTFDARHNMPRIGRITVSRGRDATDIPLATSFGPHTLKTFQVWTEEVEPDVLASLTRRIAQLDRRFHGRRRAIS